MALNRMLLFTLAFIFTWAWPLIFQVTALDEASGGGGASGTGSDGTSAGADAAGAGGGDGDGDGAGPTTVVGSAESSSGAFVRWDREQFAWIVFTQAFFLASHGTVNALIWITPLTRMRRQALARAIMRRLSSFARFTRRSTHGSHYSAQSRASRQTHSGGGGGGGGAGRASPGRAQSPVRTMRANASSSKRKSGVGGGGGGDGNGIAMSRLVSQQAALPVVEESRSRAATSVSQV